MKKLVSMLLVVSLTLAMLVTGISSVVAAETEFTGETGSTTTPKVDYNAHFFTEDASEFLTVAEGETYYFDINAPKGTNVYVYYGSGVTVNTNTNRYTVVTAGSNRTAFKTAALVKSVDGWERLSFVIQPQAGKLDYTKINFVSIGCSMTAANLANAGLTELKFSLRDSNVKNCISKDSHVHKWSTEYTIDKDAHWYECTNEDCTITETTEKDGYRVHQYEDDEDMFCNMCNYDRTPKAEDKDPVPEGVQFLIDPSATKDASLMKPTKDASTVSDFMVAPVGDMSETGTDTAYVYITKEGTTRKNGFYLETNVDVDTVGSENELIVSGWIYISDVSNQEVIMQFIPKGCLDNSVGSNYVEKWAYRYDFKTMGSYKNGWNYFNLSLSEFKPGPEERNNNHTKTAYEVNMANTKNIAAVTFHENEDKNYGKYTFAVASLAIGTKSYIDDGTSGGDQNNGEGDGEGDGEKEETPVFFVDSTESGVSGKNSSWEEVNLNGVEGDAFMLTNPASATFTIEHKGVNVSAKQGDNAAFFFYISDVNNIKEFQWEIASSGTYSGACMRYVIKADKFTQLFRDGWNQLIFELEDSSNLKEQKYDYGVYSDYYGVGLGGGMKGNVDYSAINYFRIVIHTNSAQSDLKVGIFNLAFGVNAGSTGDTTPVVNIALFTLVAALIAGGIFFYNKKRASR